MRRRISRHSNGRCGNIRPSTLKRAPYVLMASGVGSPRTRSGAFHKIYGYAEDELIGQPITMLRSARTSTETQSEILPATMAGAWSGELWNRAKDGREFPISLVLSLI